MLVNGISNLDIFSLKLVCNLTKSTPMNIEPKGREEGIEKS